MANHGRKRVNPRLFHTGLFSTDYHRFPPAPYVGRGWRLEFATPQSELPIGSEVVGDNIYQAKEVMIWAKDEISAQRAADLIHSARLLVDASNMLSHVYPGDHAPIRDATRVEEIFGDDGLLSQPLASVMTPQIPLACLIAARASQRLQYIYALAKLRLSFETYSLPARELDPQRRENVPKSPLPEDHIRLAFAIVMAYSCIEELHLEVRANAQNPSKLNGKWNQIVKDEFEDRLRRSNINLKELFHWNLRGPRTVIEKKRLPEIVKKAQWARYQVRDGNIEVIDAINYVSFLRSKVSAHRADKRLIRMLSVYDVANAQFLARRLALETMGFWRYWGNRAATTGVGATGAAPEKHAHKARRGN